MSTSLLDFVDLRLRNAGNIHIKPSIPRDKAMNAINTYAGYLTYDDIVILIDDTVFGSCKEGVIFTNEAMIVKKAFESVVYRELNKIKNLGFRKGFLGHYIILEGNEISLTQTSAEDIQYLVEKCNEYIASLSVNSNVIAKEIKLETISESQSVSESKISSAEVELAELKEKIAQLEAELESKSKENALSISAPETSVLNKVEDIKSESDVKSTYQNRVSFFTPILNSQDGFYGFTKQNHLSGSNKFINTLFSVLVDMSTLSESLCEYLSKVVVEIRENHINRNNVIGLKNNSSTVESVIYASALINNELLGRGASTRFVSQLITEGLNKFFVVDKVPGNRNLVNGIWAIASQYTTDEELRYVYAMRLYLSNKEGKPVKATFDDFAGYPAFNIMEKYMEGLIGSYDSIEVIFFKALEEFSNDVYNEIGDVPLNPNIQALTRDFSSRIFQLARENNFI